MKTKYSREKNTRVITLLTLFLFINSVCIMAQTYSIKGIVTNDSDSTTIPYASLKVFGSDSIKHTNFVANSDGKFEIIIPLKDYTIIISSIGYKDNKIHITNSNRQIDLGTIPLKENIRELNEITVYGSPIIEDVTKTIVYPTSQELKASTNGIDLLQSMQLPELFVDPVNESISVTGTSGVKYRINGVNASLQQIIALKADQVKRIEYSSLPTARELDSNSAVINVVLKELNTGTYISVNMLGAATTGFINGNANLKTIQGKSEFNLEYNINWRDYDKRRSSAKESYNKPSDTILFKKIGRNAPFGYTSQNINFGYTYNDSKQIFNARFLNSIFSSHDQLYTDIYQLNKSQNSIFRDTRSKLKNYIPSLNLYYIRKFKDYHGLEFNLVGTLMDNDYERNMSEQYEEELYEIYNKTDGKKRSLIYEGLYYNRIKNNNYSVGIRGSHSYTENDYQPNNILAKFKQTELYPYISLDGKIKNISYSLGTGLKILNTDDYSKSKTYYRNLSTVSFFYKKNNYWNIKYTFQYTPGFPSLSDLSNVDQRQDSIIIYRGNPFLKPSQTINNNLIFSFNKKIIRAGGTLFFRKTFDPLGTNIFYEPKYSSFIFQTDNQEYQYSYGGEMYLQVSSFLRYFTINPLIGWVNYKSKGNDYEYKHDSFYWGIFFLAQYNRFLLNIGYKEPLKSLSGRYINLQENYSNVELSYKNKNKNFIAKAGIRFPFTSGTKYMTEIKSSLTPTTGYTYIEDNKNMFYIGFSYYFNSGKSIFKVNKKVNNIDSDSGILKIQD